MIRVLSAIVVPPHMTASGGARAGERLSAALSEYCEISVASMMAAADTPGVKRLPIRTWLPAWLAWAPLPRRLRALFYKSDIPDRIKEGAFDLVHLHNPMPALEMRRAARACRRADIPYLVSTHGFNEIANGHSIYGFSTLRRWTWHFLVYRPICEVVRGAAGMLALSPADVPIIQAMDPRSPRVFVVPNGIDGPKRPDPTAGAITLEKFGIEYERRAGQITCMFLANHTPNKGLPILLEAFKSLKCPYLLIIGGERREEVDYDAAMRSVGEDQQIVVTGRLADEEIPALLQRSDVFVFPTLADTLPLVIFEALANGLPVLASRVGGIPHQIDDACGILVPPGDPAALAAEVRRLAAAPSRLAAMAAAAGKRAATLGSWNESARLAMNAYQAVLQRPAQSRAGQLQCAEPIASSEVLQP